MATLPYDPFAAMIDVLHTSILAEMVTYDYLDGTASLDVPALIRVPGTESEFGRVRTGQDVRVFEIKVVNLQVEPARGHRILRQLDLTTYEVQGPPHKDRLELAWIFDAYQTSPQSVSGETTPITWPDPFSDMVAVLHRSDLSELIDYDYGDGTVTLGVPALVRRPDTQGDFGEVRVGHDVRIFEVELPHLHAVPKRGHQITRQVDQTVYEIQSTPYQDRLKQAWIFGAYLVN